jgi:hypothetical protein
VQRADGRARLDAIVDLGARCLARAVLVLRLAAPGVAVRAVDAGDGAQEPIAIAFGHLVEDAAVGGNRFEQRGQLAQAVGSGHSRHR